MYHNAILHIYPVELYSSCSLSHDGSQTSHFQSKLQSGKEKQLIEITTAHFSWNMKGKEEWFLNSCSTFLILEMPLVKEDVENNSNLKSIVHVTPLLTVM